MRKRVIGGVLFLLLVLSLGACSNVDKDILGKWEDDFFGIITYDFKSDGTFVVGNGEEHVNGKFSTNGNKITLEAKGEKISGNYSIQDNTLILSSDDDAEDLELVRVTNE